METVGKRTCRRTDGGAQATTVGYDHLQYGYISNIVSAEQAVGTAECPWHVQVRPGQRINFTILNFLGLFVSRSNRILTIYHCPNPQQGPHTSVVYAGTEGPRRQNFDLTLGWLSTFTPIFHALKCRGALMS